jgi:hypothetical protein
VRGSVVVAVKVPDVPVMVMLLVPVAAVVVAVKVRMLEPVVGFVPKAAVTPAGNPETASFTLPLNPYNGATATAAVAESPVPRFKLPGAAESEKEGV